MFLITILFVIANVMWTHYVHIFFCLTVIRPWPNLPTGGHCHVICMGNLEGVFFARKYFRRPHRDPQKFIFPYKQVSGRNNDHEWLRMTNVFILCDLIWKVQKSHAVKREGSFNIKVDWTSLWYGVYFINYS